MEFMAHHVHWGMSFNEMAEEIPEAITYHTGMDGRWLLAACIVIAGLMVLKRAFR